MDITGLLQNLGMNTTEINSVVFEERVKLKCRLCLRYGIKWTCPPNIPLLDYKQILSEYDHKLLVWHKAVINNNIEIVRVKASNKLHRALLRAERELWDNNYPLAVSFIGGSCKLCPSGCNPKVCIQPAVARIPIEALGINVIKTAKQVGIDVAFPCVEYLYRVGLLTW